MCMHYYHVLSNQSITQECCIASTEEVLMQVLGPISRAVRSGAAGAAPAASLFVAKFCHYSKSS